MMGWRYRVGVGCALAFSVSTSWAFGALGHRLVGQMAQELLTPKTRMTVLRLLPEGLAVESTYLDRQRPLLNRQHPGSSAWHFIDLPVCEEVQRADILRFCHEGRCLPVQYNKAVAELKSPKTTTEEKVLDLRILLHLTGDVAQPLHAADHEDRGGNSVRVTGLSRFNLHSAYDTYFLQRRVRGRSEEEYVKYLISHYMPERSQMVKGDIFDWVLESYHQAKSFVYKDLPGFQCGQPLTRVEFTPAYTEKAEMLMERQVAAAGFRLATVLNQIFDPKPASLK